MTRRRREVDAQVSRLLSSLNDKERVLRYFRVAQQYIAINEYAEAERYLLQFIKVRGENHEAHKVLGDVYSRLGKLDKAYQEHTRSYSLRPTPETLAAICRDAAELPLEVSVKKELLGQAEKAHVSSADILALRESILRAEKADPKDLEDILKEQATLYPSNVLFQIKLLLFYSKSLRFRDCIRFITLREGEQDMRYSLRWYRLCAEIFETIRELNALPLDRALATLQLHIISRLVIALISNLQLFDDSKTSENYFPTVRPEMKARACDVDVTPNGIANEFYQQLERFDNLLSEALDGLTNGQAPPASDSAVDTAVDDSGGSNIITESLHSSEGRWTFILEHFCGQLLFAFALAMLRRSSSSSNCDDTLTISGISEDDVSGGSSEMSRMRGYSLMFSALEFKPKVSKNTIDGAAGARSIKIESESWFSNADEPTRRLLKEIHLDACYRTAVCYRCLLNVASGSYKDISSVTSRGIPRSLHSLLPDLATADFCDSDVNESFGDDEYHDALDSSADPAKEKVNDLFKSLSLKNYSVAELLAYEELSRSAGASIIHRCDAFAEKVRVATSGNASIKSVTTLLIRSGKSIGRLYSQNVLSRVCVGHALSEHCCISGSVRCLPRLASSIGAMASIESEACLRVASNIELLTWLLLSGVEFPTERMFCRLPVIPDVLPIPSTMTVSSVDYQKADFAEVAIGSRGPAQSDVDAFLSAVQAAVRSFCGSAGNSTGLASSLPTLPRELLTLPYTTSRQQTYWNALYKTFSRRTVSNAASDFVHVRKTLTDGLEFVRGLTSSNTSASMPIWFLAEIARDLLVKTQRKSSYLTAAVHYYWVIFNRLNDKSVQSNASFGAGGPRAVVALFEFPRIVVVPSEELRALRAECRIEIGKHLLHSGKPEQAIRMFEQVHNPFGYFYYSRAARVWIQQLLDEGDHEIADSLRNRARLLLSRAIKALTRQKQHSSLVKALNSELDALISSCQELHHSNVTDGGYSYVMSSNVNGSVNQSTSRVSNCASAALEPPVFSESELARIEALFKDNFEKVIADSVQRGALLTSELVALKAMQVQLVESSAKIVASQATCNSQMKSMCDEYSNLGLKFSQLSHQVTRIEDIVVTMQKQQQQLQDQQHKLLAELTLQQEKLQQQVSAVGSSVLARGAVVGLPGADHHAHQSHEQTLYSGGALVIPPGAGLPQLRLSSVQHPSVANGAGALQVEQPALQAAMSSIAVSAGASGLNSTTNVTGSSFSAESLPVLQGRDRQVGTEWLSSTHVAALQQTRILFEADGVVYKKTAGSNIFTPLAGPHKICVFHMPALSPSSSGAKSLLCFDSSSIYLEVDLNSRVTARFYGADGPLELRENIVWTVEGTDYYAVFADLSWAPAAVLMRVLRDCGVTFVTTSASKQAQHSLPNASVNDACPPVSTSLAAPSPLESMGALLSKVEAGEKKSCSLSGLKQNDSLPTSALSAATEKNGSVFQKFALPNVTTAPLFTPIQTSTTSIDSKNSPTVVTPSVSIGNISSGANTASVVSFNKADAKITEKGAFGALSDVTKQFDKFSFGTQDQFSNETKSSAPKFGGFGFTSGTAFEEKTTKTPDCVTKESAAKTDTSSVNSFKGFTLSNNFGAAVPAPVSALKPEAKSGVTPVKNTSVASNEENVNEGVSEEFESTAQFKPVIELPDLVSAQTGEENEDVVFCERAKLYRFDSDLKEWKERGLGQMKILKHPDTGRYRCVMRREHVLKLCANHQIIAGLKLESRKKATEYMWVAPDFSDGVIKHESFVIRFKTEQQAKCFKQVFDDGVRSAEAANPNKVAAGKSRVEVLNDGTPSGSMSNSGAGSSFSDSPKTQDVSQASGFVLSLSSTPGFTKHGVDISQSRSPSLDSKSNSNKSNSIFEAKASASGSFFKNDVLSKKSSDNSLPKTEVKVQPEASSGGSSLKHMFQPKPGSWCCSTCYVNNESTSYQCVACETAKPGSESSSAKPSVQPVPSQTFKFGFGAASSVTTSSQLIGSNASSPESLTPTFSFNLTPASTAGGSASTPVSQRGTDGGFAFTGGSSVSGFVFGQTSAATSSLTSTLPKFSFGTPAKEPHEFKGTSEQQSKSTSLTPKGGFTFGVSNKHEFSFETRQSGPDDDDEVAESKDVYFAPVIPLPPVVNVVTGEEGQEALYVHRAKLFRFVNKEWKERGTGDFKILRDPSTGKLRLTMRRDQVLKVCLNHYLDEETVFNRRADNRSIEWKAVDFADGEPEPTLFALRVKSEDVCNSLLGALENAQALLRVSNPLHNTSTGVIMDKALSPVSNDSDKITKVHTSSHVSTPFPFKLETTSQAAKNAPKPPLFGISNTSEKIFSAGALHKSDLSFEDDVIVIKEEKASPADVARARLLCLPDNFYLYETRQIKPCKGCRGCEIEEPSKTMKEDAALKQEQHEDLPATTSAVLSGKPGSKNVFGFSGVTFSDLAKMNTTGFAFASSGNRALWQAGQDTNFFAAFKKAPVENTGSVANLAEQGSSGAAVKSTPEELNRGASTSTEEPNNLVAVSGTASVTGGDADEPPESADVFFEPVIELPDLVDVQTGEEDEEVLFTQRAKLYVFRDGQWKERATGDAKILRCVDGRARIVVRRDAVGLTLKLCFFVCGPKCVFLLV